MRWKADMPNFSKICVGNTSEISAVEISTGPSRKFWLPQKNGSSESVAARNFYGVAESKKFFCQKLRNMFLIIFDIYSMVVRHILADLMSPVPKTRIPTGMDWFLEHVDSSNFTREILVVLKSL